MTVPKADADKNQKAAELDCRYGRIGISAVAAALSVKRDAKTPASAARPTQR